MPPGIQNSSKKVGEIYIKLMLVKQGEMKQEIIIAHFVTSWDVWRKTK